MGGARTLGKSPSSSLKRRGLVLKSAIIVVSVLFAGLAILLLSGAFRWNAGTKDLRTRLHAARRPIRPFSIHSDDFTALPAPVKRYLRLALADGLPIAAAVRIRHHGQFNMSDSAERWKPFTSDELVITQRPGFDWDARVAMAPGLAVRVHDAYVAGEGVLHAAVLGLFTVADLRGAGQIAEGELLRFLAEAAWYPTALLPSQGVRWEEIDERSARATLIDGSVSATLIFEFDEEGLIDNVRAEARGRVVGDQIVPTPWRGRFWNYQKKDGMLIPLDGEVAWLLPEGEKTYWRGHIVEITYEPPAELSERSGNR